MARTYRSREQWLEIIQQFNHSQMSVAAFCREQDLNQASFYNWRKQLSEPSPSAESQPLFVDITPPVSQPAPGSPVWDVELELGQGMSLRIRRPC